MLKPKQFSPKRVSGAKKYNPNARIDAMYLSSEWISFRARFLLANPHCYACGRNSEVADHLVPHKGDWTLFKKEDNVIPLCSRCHNTITAKFDKRYTPKSPIQEKLKWLASNRSRNSVSTRVVVISWNT